MFIVISYWSKIFKVLLHWISLKLMKTVLDLLLNLLNFLSLFIS